MKLNNEVAKNLIEFLSPREIFPLTKKFLKLNAGSDYLIPDPQRAHNKHFLAVSSLLGLNLLSNNLFYSDNGNKRRSRG
jgi:hypothetical protein